MNDSRFPSGLLAELVHLRPDLVQRFLRLRCERAEAEDLTQDTLLRGVRSLPTYRPTGSMRPWARAIARNVYLEQRRAARRRERVIVAEPETVREPLALDVPPDVCAQLGQMRRRLQAAVDAMPDRLFEVFFLVYLEERTYDEAQKELGISRDAVKMRALRVRRYLQEELHDFRDAYRGVVPPMPPGGSLASLVQKVAPMLGHVASVFVVALLLLPLSRVEAPSGAHVGVAREICASAAEVSAASEIALDEPTIEPLGAPLANEPTPELEPRPNPRPKHREIEVKLPGITLVDVR